MVRTWRWFFLSSMACPLLIGCPQRNAGQDAGADGAPSASVEAAAPIAANDSDVTKYPDQSNDYMAPLGAKMTVNAHVEANTSSKVVASIKAGTQVSEVADHAGYDLVVFPDPNDSTRNLEGWVTHTAFVAEPRVITDGGVHLDAGPAAADAGPSPTPPATGFVCVKQTAGKCPAGFAVSGAVCRVPCGSPADCHGPDPKCNAGKCYASNGCE